MTDAANGGDDASSSANPPALSTAASSAPTTAPASTSASQSTSRTDHDRQYFYLPQNPLKRSRPHVTQNLISDYGLDAVHNRVRRVDPATGEKINKLRKSYVGIVKNLHLAGSNKEVPEPGAWIDTVNMHDPTGLMDKKTVETGEIDIVDGMQIPRTDEVWKVDVQPVSKQRAQNLLAKLGIAVQMAPGKIEDGEKWRKMLGEETVKKPAVPLLPSLKASGAALGSAAASSARPSPRMGPTAGRTQRTGAKRSYDESSFSGYNETFDDVDGRVSQAEALRKKQRKDIPISQSLAAQSPYNVGLMAGGGRQR